MERHSGARVSSIGVSRYLGEKVKGAPSVSVG